MARLSQIFLPKDREFFDLFEEAGGNILRAAELLEQMLRDLPRARRAGARHPHLRAGRRPHHARHHPAAQRDVRHADRPRGHLRARLGARRHRRLHRGGRGLPRPLQDRGADGAGAGDGRACCSTPRARSPRRCRGCAGSSDIPHFTVEINRLENEGDRLMREALASLFEDGIDPMVVIRWKDIYERLEDGDRRHRDGREHPRGHRHQELLASARRQRRRSSSSSSVHGARVRLHERLPRHRERGRHLDLHARDAAAAGRRLRRDAQLRRRVHLAEGRGHGGAAASSTPSAITPTIVFAGLIGAIGWNLITWYFGLPSSSSHALIGGLVGACSSPTGAERGDRRRPARQGGGPGADRAGARVRRRRRSRSWSPTGSSARLRPGPVTRRLPARPARSRAGCSRSRTAPTTRRRRWA